MEKIKKYLLKLSQEERTKIEDVLEKIVDNDIDGLDIKKLKGYEDIYRVRIGKNRIIFQRVDGAPLVLEISRRQDTPYKKIS